MPAPHSRLSSPVLAAVPVQSSTVNFSTANDAQVSFDVVEYIKLVPPIQEAEVDAYFTAFECTAEKLGSKCTFLLLILFSFVRLDSFYSLPRQRVLLFFGLAFPHFCFLLYYFFINIWNLN